MAFTTTPKCLQCYRLLALVLDWRTFFGIKSNHSSTYPWRNQILCQQFFWQWKQYGLCLFWKIL